MSGECDGFPQALPVGAPPASTPEPLGPVLTRLVTSPSDPWKWGINRETDATLALRRGLAEYFSQQSISMGGRLYRLVNSLDDWADGEVIPDYPSAATYSLETGTYDASSLTAKTNDRLPDGRQAMVSDELSLNIITEVWATDRVERSAIVAMLEDAMQPVTWMHGVRLELPFYYNVRAEYAKTGIQYVDDEANATRRYRLARLLTRGVIPVVRPIGLPKADIRFRAKVDGEG